MSSALLGLLAETSIHPGTGRTVGVVDLPVAREAATDYPVIVGTSLKGALRDKATTILSKDELNRHFGVADSAGDLLISDARILLLPVRSLTGAYRWVTCPHIIERLRRDLERTGVTPVPAMPSVEHHQTLTHGDGQLFLEERHFSIAGPPPADIVEAIRKLLLHDDTAERLSEQLAIIHDDDFAWFARYGLSIQARNKLDENTKQSKNLWYEETLPPDTVMYAVVLGRRRAATTCLGQLFSPEDPYLQTGGNETVGQGWFAVQVRSGAEPARAQSREAAQ